MIRDKLAARGPAKVYVPDMLLGAALAVVLWGLMGVICCGR